MKHKCKICNKRIPKQYHFAHIKHHHSKRHFGNELMRDDKEWMITCVNWFIRKPLTN